MRGGADGAGGGGASAGGGPISSGDKPETRTCRYCQKVGHLLRDCPDSERDHAAGKVDKYGKPITALVLDPVGAENAEARGSSSSSVEASYIVALTKSSGDLRGTSSGEKKQELRHRRGARGARRQLGSRTRPGTAGRRKMAHGLRDRRESLKPRAIFAVLDGTGIATMSVWAPGPCCGCACHRPANQIRKAAQWRPPPCCSSSSRSRSRRALRSRSRPRNLAAEAARLGRDRDENALDRDRDGP